MELEGMFNVKQAKRFAKKCGLCTLLKLLHAKNVALVLFWNSYHRWFFFAFLELSPWADIKIVVNGN